MVKGNQQKGKKKTMTLFTMDFFVWQNTRIRNGFQIYDFFFTMQCCYNGITKILPSSGSDDDAQRDKRLRMACRNVG